MSDKSLFGLDEKVSGLLSYAGFFVSGIIYLVLERENKFVRFHAMQSTIWFALLLALRWIVGFLSGIPLLGLLFGIVSWLLGILAFVSWVYLMYMAYKGNSFRIPVLGDAVWNQINQ
jgi:uncharacterized membrane protein